MTGHQPTISVYTACRNGARYLEETLASIFDQTLQDFELVVADGASDDGTVDLLRSIGRDPRVHWFSEPDGGPAHGFSKALSLVTGRYVMFLPVSDCYLSRTWFARCAAVLDRDDEVSMVHGSVTRMHDDGTLLGPLHPSWWESPPPNKDDYFAYWLATFMHASEITCCFRREVYRECYPPYPARPSPAHDALNLADPLTDRDFAEFGPHMKCLLTFHSAGYLAWYLPVTASAAREHSDNLTTFRKRYLMLEAKRYSGDIVACREAILEGRTEHAFRNGRGEIIRRIGAADREMLAARIAAYRASERLMFDQIDEANADYRRRAALVRTKWREWASTFGPHAPIALYGGGMHTEQLLEIIGPDLHALNVVAIVDRRPCHGERMKGIRLFPKTEFDFSSVEHIIISSRCHEAEIFEDLLELLPASRIERLYGRHA